MSQLKLEFEVETIMKKTDEAKLGNILCITHYFILYLSKPWELAVWSQMYYFSKLKMQIMIIVLRQDIILINRHFLLCHILRLSYKLNQPRTITKF